MAKDRHARLMQDNYIALAQDRYISGDDYVNIRKGVRAELVEMIKALQGKPLDDENIAGYADCYTAYIMCSVTEVVDVRHSDGAYWSHGEYHDHFEARTR